MLIVEKMGVVFLGKKIVVCVIEWVPFCGIMEPCARSGGGGWQKRMLFRV